MARVDDLLKQALKALPQKPADNHQQAAKKRYSEQASAVIAQAFAEELRQRGMKEARPAPPGDVGLSGAERRLAGGIGAKKVDVTWATEESGLLLALSVKTINFRDARTGNFQKNLTNRRGDLLIEAVTLHRRFPYAVLGGFLFLDWDAQLDATEGRQATFANAHSRLRLFTNRYDPAGRDEQWERLYLVALRANPFDPQWKVNEVGSIEDVSLDTAFDELVGLVADRNFDFYDVVSGNIVRIGQRLRDPYPSSDGGPSLDDVLVADDEN
ncbi:MAG: hypothetical protein ACREN2_02625 [Candidatus Dormibacteria bacterium]